MSAIWAECSARAVPRVLDGIVLRLVESQEQVATNALVRTFAEQALLEDLIDSSKPAVPAEAAGLHYLLATPFRYPPLPWGSRFGTRFEPSLYYAARSIDTALAEGAYYRYVFWTGMAEPPPAPLETRHALFGAALHTPHGLRLQEPPFAGHRSTLAHPADYGATQTLGTALRAAGIEAFEYRSARDPSGAGVNVALFTPAAFAEPRPTHVDEWLCATGAGCVTYYSRHAGGVREFPIETFLVNGELPRPAA